ncbi:MAG TPA: hypothetical protein VGK93_08195 [Candidatus Eisenbacteria bacterium]|jgi:hypothetical protein
MNEAPGKDGRQETILRKAMLEAVRFGYDGPGKDWPGLPAQDLRERISRGEHVAILRDEVVVRTLCGQRFVRGIGAVVTVINPVTRTSQDQWKQHHDAIQNADPLEYLAPFIQ